MKAGGIQVNMAVWSNIKGAIIEELLLELLTTAI